MINMKKITLILPLFVFLNTIVASCSKEAETTNVNMFLEENNLEISRLSSDSSLYNAIQGRWKITAEREKIGSFFFQTWNNYFIDFNSDSVKFMQIDEEKDMNSATKTQENICLYAYKMSFHAPNQLFFNNEIYTIARQEEQKITIGSDNHGILLER